jgi:imidazolonepropionase-like amidohydrolase
MALRAVTSVPARLLGMSDRVGTIARGRLANLVVLDGEAFAPGSRVTMVLVKGNVVYQGAKQ